MTLRSPFTRRAALAGTTGAAAWLALPVAITAGTLPADARFRHGVASGDPDATSVVLWTRISGMDKAEGNWEVSATPDYARVLKSGRFMTGADRHFKVKVLATP